MRYLLDTNIILHLIRYSNFAQRLEKDYDLLENNTKLYISTVTQGEIQSLALQHNWGKRRLQQLDDILNDLVILDIKIQNLINLYAEIDAFSQGKLQSVESKFSARNMGKNDLWIAASAAYFDLPLMTTDKDFDHLQERYCHIINP